jgi:predicted SprT family Zn-dependent metalloprotease
MATECPTEEALGAMFDALARVWYPGRRIPFRVEWSRRMSRSAGMCYPRTRVIRLSWRYHVEYPAEVESTLKHELIHAAGIRGHGADFLAEARRLGCDVRAMPMPGRPFRWVYACPACGAEVRTRRKVDYSCGRCSPRWNPRYRLTLKRELPRRAGHEHV